MATCIPCGSGVPYLDGAPNWGFGDVATTVINTVDPQRPTEGAIKDPRWLGAANQGFGIGTSEEASFRALFSESAGKRYLYFSWHVKFDADPGSTIDRLYAAVAPSAGGGGPLLIEIQPFNDNADHLTAALPYDMKAGRRQADGTKADLPDPPAWLNDTRAWRFGVASAQGQWAIHVRLPIDPSATDVDGDNGIRLVGSFKMWYELRIKTTTRADMSTTGISTSGVLRLSKPDGVTLTGGGTVYPDPNASGETYTFGNVVGMHEVSCAAIAGISLTYLDVGTTNDPPSYIDPVGVNTFYAQPTNNGAGSVGAGAINAVFRLANWGSTRHDAEWTTIRDGVTNSGLIPGGAKATSANDIRFNKSDMAAAYPKVNQEPHQCMMVELSGAGVVFTNTSVFRNMDFVHASKLVRRAYLSARGLKAVGGRPHDFYLAIEMLNMPRTANVDLGHFGPVLATNVKPSDTGDPQSLFHKIQQARTIIKERFTSAKYSTPEQRLGLMLDALRQVRATPEELDQIFPTYRVHVYYDSGETWRVNGITYPLLGLLPSFGFYVYDEGVVRGYNAQLHGAIRVAESFHVLRVPARGSASITTAIHAIAPGEERDVEPDEPIVDWPKKPDVEPCADNPADPWLLRLLKAICRLLIRLRGR